MSPDALPPLIALRALEASARLGSFARAADELGVTPSAITQHVRTMETWVGAPLFRRTGRQVLATERMTAVQQELSTAFDELTAATRALKAPSRNGHTLSISAPPSFASKWLQPRLDRFRSLYNEYDVWISADLNLVDFSSSDIDIAIRYGSGIYEGLVAEKILAEQVSPVASPSLIKTYGPFKSPSDLLRAPLLHDSNPENDPSCPDWEMWLKARGAPTDAARRGLRFNQTSMVIEEAVAGRGVALAKHAIAAADIGEERLQRVFDDATPLAFAYYLVWPRGRTLTRPARAFIAWIKEETLGAMIEGAGI